MARPETGADGALNLMIWQCTLPGKTGVCLSSLHSPTVLLWVLLLHTQKHWKSGSLKRALWQGGLSIVILLPQCGFKTGSVLISHFS